MDRQRNELEDGYWTLIDAIADLAGGIEHLTAANITRLSAMIEELNSIRQRLASLVSAIEVGEKLP